MIKQTKILVKNFHFYVGYNEKGIVYIGSIDGEIDDILNYFDNVQNVDTLSNFSVLEKEMNLYFDQKLKNFTVPLDLHGTPFQVSVWNSLLKIPYGKTYSYEMVSEMVGDKKRVRAVANAIGRNPISIIVPCHRVIRKNGSIGGYGGGLDMKRTLFDVEGIDLERGNNLWVKAKSN